MYEISVLRSVTLYTKKKCSQHWNVLYIKSCLSWSHWDLILLYTIKQKIQKNAAPNILHDKICSRVLWWSHWPCWNCIVSLRLHPVISVYSQYLIWTWGITYPPTASPIAYATNSISHLQDGSIVLQCPPPPAPFHFLQVIQCMASLSFREALFFLPHLQWRQQQKMNNRPSRFI